MKQRAFLNSYIEALEQDVEDNKRNIEVYRLQKKHRGVHMLLTRNDQQRMLIETAKGILNGLSD